MSNKNESAQLMHGKAEFTEHYVSTFMGCDFKLKDIKTLGDLRIGLRMWLCELDGWGDDDTELSECEIMQDRLIVTIKDGIVQ